MAAALIDGRAIAARMLEEARAEAQALAAAGWAPRLVSVSARSKQYDHCASAVALPTAAAHEAPMVSIAAGIWPLTTDIEVCSCPATTDSMPMKSGSPL